ncbi:bacterioferritin-associated ferredoxin [Aliidiomarina soli]|uniref:bacterioferritin-associated ferredoxin n=1 Tax=Aliidiomarina soli TaxID=1928574 RepID=UPI001F545A46|nr:bacterioferritin-associated ferredoxin [Aliidiomarina soli]
MCLNSAMYVCLCKAVTDKDIQRAVQAGASSMRCLRQEHGVASQCGRCAGHAKEVLDDALQQQAPVTEATVTVVTGTGSGVCYP